MIKVSPKYNKKIIYVLKNCVIVMDSFWHHFILFNLIIVDFRRL